MTNQSASGLEQTVEVAHEALISHWSTLRAWVNENREFLLWRDRLGTLLTEWARAQESDEALLRGPLLNEAQKWFDQRSQDLSDQERKFISTSRELRERLAREEKERQEPKLGALRNLAEAQRRERVEEAERREQQEKMSRKLLSFLCHSSHDKMAVRELYRRLNHDGFSAWLDEENLIPGQAWDTEIQAAVRASDVVIVCLSRSSITKDGYVQKEIRYALDVAEEKSPGTIFLIPARLDECTVPERLKGVHWVDLFKDQGYEKLLKALRKRGEALGVVASIHV